MKIIIILIFLSFTESVKLSYDDFREFLSLKKRENVDDFEQCAPVNFVMGQLGVVNVLAFLDNSWPYSHKQAELFKSLKDRLQHSGLPDALFFVITKSSSNSIDSQSESEIEREAWKNVAPEEAIELSSNLMKYDSLEKSISPDIFMIEDTEELGIWKELGGMRDQILVIDRCGKLSYQIIVPWSILHFPYVKAAILSTHKDNPCGKCDSFATITDFDDIEDKTFDEVTEINKEINVNFDENKNFPLKIIMHAPHIHLNSDSQKKHEYLVLESDKPNYHGHLDIQNDEKSDEIIKKFSSFESISFDDDESPGLYGEVADYWRDFFYQIETIKPDEFIETTTSENYQYEDSTNFNEFTVEEEESKSKLIAHYSKLLPWIYYVLDK